MDNNWISVEDRLPSNKEEVLVFVDTYFDLITKGWYCSDSDEWFIEDNGGRFANVSHWQPLPQPPHNNK